MTGSATRLGPGAACAMDADAFRAAMRHFPTGVTVLATSGPAGPHGMTANAVISLSLDPPTVLAAVHHRTCTYTILRSAPTFTVNVLAADQEDLAVAFARSSPDRDPFDRAAWQPSVLTGDPTLTRSVGVLHCRVTERIDVTDHTLVIGTVIDATVHRPEAAPLVFARGGFHALAGPPPAGPGSAG
ncbi:flavin reductase family protein [Streptomyces sp. HSW2009]|uniref:flavin reductase family protein n=1 Tax=Streptomyces sp. HSW2009 TaxID=3142890 RepID=UPI0032EC0468